VKRRALEAEVSAAPEDGERRPLSGVEIVTLAVFVLGGDSHYVDTEDIAVKANELAPGKFTWLKYKDQINIHVIKTHLWDAKSERKGGLLLGSEKEGWMLSTSGVAIARTRLEALKHLKAAKLSDREKRRIRTERERMVKTDAFAKLGAGAGNTVTLEEAETFFRLNAYIVGKARERKILSVINVFGDDPELGPLVRSLAEKVRSKASEHHE
jgi:hypothetical protein